MSIAKQGNVLELVTFRLGNEEYGVDIARIQEVNRMVRITAMPNAPDYIEGIMNLRGRVMPVINLRKKFGMPLPEDGDDMRIIVVDAGTTVGLLVDSVSEVLRITSDLIEAPPDVGQGDSSYVVGIVKHEKGLLLLMDAVRLLGPESIPLLAQ